MLFMLESANAAPSQPVPKMRPYAGIGVLFLRDAALSEPLFLYEEPGLSRIGQFNPAKAPSHGWIFGNRPGVVALMVMARKGAWLRVSYDDAGREGWLAPARETFIPWRRFLKGQTVRLLPGLQKRYYQLYRQPGGDVFGTATSRQGFRCLRADDEWLMVMVDQKNLAWLRWRDEDGRLLVGCE